MFSQFSLPLPEKFENPARDSAISSTNQTSVEVSIDDIIPQANENFPNTTDQHNNPKFFKTKPLRPLSESKKLQPGRHYRYTDTGKSSKNRPGSVEKYKPNLSLEARSSKKLENRPEATHKTQFLEATKKINHKNLKLKQFTPILSNKRVRLFKLDAIDSKSVNSIVPPKPDSVLQVTQKINENLLKNEKPEAKLSPVAFCSPLRNLKNFQNVAETAENPYANFELSPNLTLLLEDLQHNLVFSSEEEEEEEEVEEKELKGKNREPSFGFGGGEFSYEDSQVVEETLYYEPRISESEKNVQTDDRGDIKSILSIVTNQEFINSLKIIGKFASFIENNLVVN